MEFGMFHEFQALPGETAAQSFANSLAQVDAAEEKKLAPVIKASGAKVE